MPFEQPGDRAAANIGQYNDVAGHQMNNHNTLNNRISAGDGGSGGRGGDVTHTIYNFYGPQYIVNASKDSLNFDENQGTVTSRPFDGSLNQMWILEDRQNGKFAIVSADNAEYLSSKGQDGGLHLSQTAQLWRVTPEGSAFKIMSPESGLTLTLGCNASLSPLSIDGDVNQSLYILENTPENQERIKSGKLAQPPASGLLQEGEKEVRSQLEANTGESPQAPKAQTARPTEAPTVNHTSIDIPGAAGQAGMNVTINYYGDSASDMNILEELRKFLALDGARNLVVFLGHPLLSTVPLADPSTVDPASTSPTDSASRTCSPSTPSSRHTCPTITRTRFQISSGDSCYITADSSDITSKVWFKTQALDADWLRSVTSLQLFTISRDQGWAASDEDASWTWFEIVILDDPTDYQPKTTRGRGPLRWVSHYNRRAHPCNSKLSGPKFKKSHEIFGWTEPGNALAVCVCAQHPGWQNHAEAGHLHFEMLG
ncbi:unnamed protein product [Cyclocybe aegerita]|uniref:Ricin B lectin domain-containing protein n=1 Tax=Cyclocybe aegerita TaxID=1973307 RepID=A0A8S0XPH6_CYCAE|nr:unnamed protein product [Cyclocybe aegerita]